jgi:hypothetical protein
VLRAQGEETLTLVEAAAACGYSQDHIGNLIRRGKLPNAGWKNAPRIRRSDLPSKAPTSPGRPPARQGI